MQRSSIHPVSNCVNQIIKSTILKAEDILKALKDESTNDSSLRKPRKTGSNNSQRRSTCPVGKQCDPNKEVCPKKKECQKERRDRVSARSTASSSGSSRSCCSQKDRSPLPRGQHLRLPSKPPTRCDSSDSQTSVAKINPGSIKVTELKRVVGIIVSLVVVVENAPEGRRTIDITLECPNFVPNRICIDGQWRNVV